MYKIKWPWSVVAMVLMIIGGLTVLAMLPFTLVVVLITIAVMYFMKESNKKDKEE